MVDLESLIHGAGESVRVNLVLKFFIQSNGWKNFAILRGVCKTAISNGVATDNIFWVSRTTACNDMSFAEDVVVVWIILTYADYPWKELDSSMECSNGW